MLAYPLPIEMVSNRRIQVRLTRDQYERLKNHSEVRGFGSLSAYIRFMALDQDLVLQQKLYEIHAHLLGGESGSKVRPKNRSQSSTL